MKFNYTQQKNFFDMTDHQYSQEDILHPPRAQQLEYQDLEAQLHTKAYKNILDFGCGSGRTTMHFLRHGFNVTGFDISETPLHQLFELYKKNKSNNWGKLTITNTIPHHTRFDAIIGADILHHVTLAQALSTIYQSLKPNGVIAFSEPNPLHLPWYGYYVLGGRPLSVEYGILQCSIWNLKKQLSIAGFRNISIKGHGLFPTKLLPSFLKLDQFNAHVFGNLPLVKLFAFRYIITATK